jgi:hypothetical protein
VTRQFSDLTTQVRSLADEIAGAGSAPAIHLYRPQETSAGLHSQKTAEERRAALDVASISRLVPPHRSVRCTCRLSRSNEPFVKHIRRWGRSLSMLSRLKRHRPKNLVPDAEWSASPQYVRAVCACVWAPCSPTP